MSGSVAVLRALIWLSGGVALWAALPGSLDLPLLVLLGLAIVPAVVPALLPGRWVPLAFGMVLVLCWLVRTGVLSEPIHPVSLLVLAIAWYAQHSLCALAAGVPMNAIVTAEVFRHWLVRALPAYLAAVVGATLVTLLAPTSFGELPVEWRGRAPLALILLGLLTVPVLAAIPVWLLDRRSTDDPDPVSPRG